MAGAVRLAIYVASLATSVSMLIALAGVARADSADNKAVVIDIVVELPQQGDGPCPDAGGGLAELHYDGDDLGLTVRKRSHRSKSNDPSDMLGAHTVIPPDFAVPQILQSPANKLAVKLREREECPEGDTPQRCWMKAYAQTRLALATSTDIFSHYYGMDDTGDDNYCPAVTEVYLSAEEAQPILAALEPANVGNAKDCPYLLPEYTPNPTVCIPWPIPANNAGWPGLHQTRERLYKVAHMILEAASRMFKALPP